MNQERPEDEPFGDCILGIDIGTTTLKCAILQKREKQGKYETRGYSVDAVSSVNVDAYFKDRPAGHKMQDSVEILDRLVDAVAKLPKLLLERVDSVGRSIAANIC